MLTSQPINITRYTNGTLVQLVASSHDFLSFDYDPETETGTYQPDAIYITAKLSGHITLDKWQYALSGSDWMDVDGVDGITVDGNTLTITGDCEEFVHGAITIRALGSDGIHDDTVTITRQVEPQYVYDRVWTDIVQTNSKIALLASEEQLAQLSESETFITKTTQFEQTANQFQQTVTTNYATKQYTAEATSGMYTLQIPYTFEDGVASFKAVLLRNGYDLIANPTELPEDAVPEVEPGQFEWYIKTEATNDREWLGSGYTVSVDESLLGYGGTVTCRYTMLNDLVTLTDENGANLTDENGSALQGYPERAALEAETSLYQKDALTRKFAQLTINENEIRGEISRTRTEFDNKLGGYTTTQQFSTLSQTVNGISTEVGTKVGNNEIISKINQSAEQVSILANKINFNGLVTANNNFKINLDGSAEMAAGLIGLIHVISNAIYSGSHSTLQNNSPGFYLGADGQIGIGDGSTYLRFINDNGTYKLIVRASSLLIGGKDVATQEAVTAAQNTANGAVSTANSAATTASTANQNASTALTTANATVKSAAVQYYVSTSPTTLSGGSWSASQPTWEAGKYIWTRTEWTNQSNVKSYSDPVCITGAPGAQGYSATAYNLIISTAAVAKRTNGTLSPETVTLSATAQTGEADTVAYTGRFWIYKSANGTNWTKVYPSGDGTDQSTLTYTYPSDANYLRCELHPHGGGNTVLDAQTIPLVLDGTNGNDAYTVILGNESHTFAADTTQAVTGAIEIPVYGYKGATKVDTTVGTITKDPQSIPNMTVEILNNSSQSTKVRVSIAEGMTTQKGTLTIPVTVDGNTFNKVFSFALALKGVQGNTGVGITSITPLYYCSSSSTAPNKPTTQVTTNNPTTYNQWNLALPAMTPTYKYYYTCNQVWYTDGVMKWSNVVTDNAMVSAASTATNYMHYDSTNGLTISEDASSADGTANYPYNVQIVAGEVNIRNRSVVLAKFASNGLVFYFTAGKPGMELTANTLNFYKYVSSGNAQTAASLGSAGLNIKEGNLGGFKVRSSTNAATTANDGHLFDNVFFTHSSDDTYEYEIGFHGATLSGSANSGAAAMYVARIAKNAVWNTANRTILTQLKQDGTLETVKAKIAGWTIDEHTISTSKMSLQSQYKVGNVNYPATLTLGGWNPGDGYARKAAYIDGDGVASFNKVFMSNLIVGDGDPDDLQSQSIWNSFHVTRSKIVMSIAATFERPFKCQNMTYSDNANKAMFIISGGVGTIAYGAPSSRRYKDIDRAYKPVDVEKLYSLRVYRAKYKDGFLAPSDASNGLYMPMFVAEEVEEVLPEAVRYQDGQVEDWKERVMIPAHHLMIVDQKVRNDAQDEKIKALEAEVMELKAQIKELKEMLTEVMR